MTSKNQEKKEIRLKEKSAIKHFKFIRPNLVKLFTHAILLYLTISSYISFTDTETIYNDFLVNLNQSLVVDVKFINSTSTCESPYESIETTYFPVVNNGCRCDFQFFKDDSICSHLRNLSLRFESEWASTCAIQDAQPSASSPNRNLQTQAEFQIYSNFPSNCRCYSDINGTTENKTIDIWFKNTKICLLKDPHLSTLDYLRSAMNTDDCKIEDMCQNYFCKTHFPKRAYGSMCPIVDVYFDHVTYSKKGNRTIQVQDSDNWYMHPTTFYNKTFVDNSTFEDTILVPLLGMTMSRGGKCTNDGTLVDLDYSLVENVNCPIDQRYFTASKQPLSNILTNNNHFSSLSRIPGFNKTLNNELKWNLDLKYGFYRNTLTCLMVQYDQLNGNSYFPSMNQTDLGDFQYRQKKIGYILKAFVTFSTSFMFQNNIQIAILALNSFLVSISVFIVAYKLLRYCYEFCLCSDKVFDLEKYLTFSLEFCLGVLGGVSYFLLSKYSNFMSNLVSSGCVDNYVQYEIGIFAQSLSSTADQNFEVFLIIFLKLFFITLSVVYYSCSKGARLNCKEFKHIFEENIAEGEDGDYAQLKGAKIHNTSDVIKSEESQNKSKNKSKKNSNLHMNASDINMVNINSNTEKLPKDSQNDKKELSNENVNPGFGVIDV